MKNELVDEALDAACLVIQNALGQTDGGIAGTFFTGREDIRVILLEYINLELSSARFG